MVGDPAAYGLCFLALVNAGIFILFALSFFNPATARDWRSLGARISVVLHAKLTRDLHLKMTHPVEPEYGSGLGRFPGFGLLGGLC